MKNKNWNAKWLLRDKNEWINKKKYLLQNSIIETIEYVTTKYIVKNYPKQKLVTGWYIPIVTKKTYSYESVCGKCKQKYFNCRM